MAKNDQQDAYEEALVTNLARVLDLLKFAEAKNAALLAFTSAWTVAIANLMARQEAPPAAFADVLPVSGALFLIAALVALYSILPKVRLAEFFKGEQRIARELNLLFYGDISQIDIATFPERLRTRYYPADKCSTTDQYLTDLSCQIHVNSTIASRKYTLFKIGAWVTLGSMIILVSPAAWYLLKGVINILVTAAR